MEFKSVRSSGGTGLVGYLPAGTSYSDLVAAFGEPQGPGDKTLAEWCIRFQDGTIATIYDYKTCGKTREQVTDWHVGGTSITALYRVMEALNPLAWLEAPKAPDPAPAGDVSGVLVF